MVQANLVSAAVAGSSSPRPPYRAQRTSSHGSFHAGDIIPTFDHYERDRADPSSRRRSATLGRRQSVVRYHTFPTAPPRTPSETTTITNDHGGDEGVDDRVPTRAGQSRRAMAIATGHDDGHRLIRGQGSPKREATPLPLRQVLLLAVLSLAEQTALNSLAPYLPTMVSSFEEIPREQMGLYVGLLASAFAMAQLATNLFWGYLSDVVGRKPIILTGSFLLMLCFCFFGFCTTFWQVVVVHVAMGLLNGNAAVVPTCLGEVTDRTNQSSVFTWLPVIYSIGSITGPALGGLLVGDPKSKYPFLAPNIASAALLGAAVVVLAIWFDETLDRIDDKPVPPVFAATKRFFQSYFPPKQAYPIAGSTGTITHAPRTTSSASSILDSEGVRRLAQEEDALLRQGNSADESPLKDSDLSVFHQLLDYKTVLLLLTYLVFQVSNISFNSLFPIFSSAPEPTGRNLSPGDIGVLLSLAGLATIFFQVTAFQPVLTRMGNLGTYRLALCGLSATMLVIPWVGHAGDTPLFHLGTGERWLFIEMAAVLAVKNICAVGGLSSVMLLITNSAPSHETLGTLNGIAQTLSAAGRSVGPFVSGALFSISTQIKQRGELLAWSVFGGVAMVGWLGSLAVEGRGLESADWHGHDSNTDCDDTVVDEEAH